MPSSSTGFNSLHFELQHIFFFCLLNFPSIFVCVCLWNNRRKLLNVESSFFNIFFFSTWILCSVCLLILILRQLFWSWHEINNQRLHTFFFLFLTRIFLSKSIVLHQYFVFFCKIISSGRDFKCVESFLGTWNDIRFTRCRQKV